MTQAMNYAAQAQRDLVRWAKANTGRQPDAVQVRWFADRIGQSVHFSLPDNGELFSDQLRGLRGMDVRLPFPEITVEYAVDPERFVPAAEAPIFMPKRLVYAAELDPDTVAARFGQSVRESFDNAPVIYILAANEHQGQWIPITYGWLLPIGWQGQPGETTVSPIVAPNPGAPTIRGMPMVLCPTLAREIEAHFGEQHGRRQMVHDIAGEVTAVLELCEALSCSNVGSTVLQPAAKASVNERRLRDGKVPIYETRTLTVTVPGQSEPDRLGASSGRQGPRQHLRRGHIRTLADQRRIWVNACVVGQPGSGRIDKQYRIKT